MISESQNIFRAYDVRGIYGKDINENIAQRFGQAFGTLMGKGSKIAVGSDVRLSSDSLKRSLISGLTSVGCSAVDIGEVPSPVLYYAPIRLNLDGGVMVTASHLPPEWNGFKTCDSSGIVLSEGTGLEKVREIFFSEKFSRNSPGKVESSNLIEDYTNFVSSKISLKKKMRIVLDLANSVASLTAPKILKRLGAEVINIHEELDGRSPNRESEPTEKSLQKLKQKVVESGADMGIGYDGDADRMSLVDELGRVFFSGNILIPIFARSYLSGKQGGKVVMDLTCSSAVEDFVKQNGGKPVVIRVGHSYCSHATKNEHALFGGQYSGHMCFPETSFTDDAIFASIKMVEIISSQDKKLSEIVDEIPKYPASKVAEIHCDDSIKFEVVEKIGERLRKDGYKILNIDGVKAFDKDGGWMLIRGSNTLPVIKVNSEARNEKKMKELFDFGNKIVSEGIKNFGS